jgi:hypothetical protein
VCPVLCCVRYAAGDVYFANSLTGVTSWDHPLEDEFRALAESVRQRKKERAAADAAAAAEVGRGRKTKEAQEDDAADGRSERSYGDDTEYEESDFESSVGTSLGTSFGTSMGTSFGTSLGQSQSFRRAAGGGVGGVGGGGVAGVGGGGALDVSAKRGKLGKLLPAAGAVGYARWGPCTSCESS